MVLLSLIQEITVIGLKWNIYLYSWNKKTAMEMAALFINR